MIDLDITKGKWEKEQDPWCVDIYRGLGPIRPTWQSGESALYAPDDDAIATLCVPEFKQVADAALVLLMNIEVAEVGLKSIEAKVAMRGVGTAIRNLNLRIKELKND